MKLVIAEKPSVGGGLAEVLGAKSRKDGYIEGKQEEYQVSFQITVKKKDFSLGKYNFND